MVVAGGNAAVEALFDGVAADWDPGIWFERSVRSEFAYRVTRRRLLAAADLGPGDEVLEIGCGPGTWTRVMAERAREVTAVDISTNMLEAAARFVDLPNVSFVHADLLKFSPGRLFSRVVSLRAIEYVDDPVEATRRLASWVAPGGRLVIVTKTPTSAWRGRRWFATHFPHRGARDEGAGQETPAFYHRRLSPGRLIALLQRNGLREPRVLPAVYGLPVLAGVAGDVPIAPSRFHRPLLRAFDRAGDLVSSLPQPLARAGLVFSESYVLTMTKPAREP